MSPQKKGSKVSLQEKLNALEQFCTHQSSVKEIAEDLGRAYPTIAKLVASYKKGDLKIKDLREKIDQEK